VRRADDVQDQGDALKADVHDEHCHHGSSYLADDFAATGVCISAH
jgi:hypothetical protein